MPDDRSVTEAETEQDELEEIDNPIERLKLLSGSDEEIASYLDTIAVTSPREREMLREISRTRPLARPELFPRAHRNMVEALESLARHGYKGTAAGSKAGPFRVVVRWGVQLVARYLVVSHIRNVSTQLRNLYGLREIQAVPGTKVRYLLRGARMDAERMVDALETRELALPAFPPGGRRPSLDRRARAHHRPARADALGRRDRRRGHAGRARRVLGDPARRRAGLAPDPAGDERPGADPLGDDRLVRQAAKDSARTFVIVSLTLTLGAWIIVPILVAIALAT